MQKSSPLTTAEIAEIDASYRARLRSLLAVDELVQRVVDTLEASGALDNTYIFLTSDNGYDLGEHRLTLGKGTPYEPAIHVPLLVRGPGVAAGQIEARLVVNTDLAPTFAALAGAETPDFVDGRSLLPLLHGEEGSWRRAVLSQFIDEFHVLVTADRAYIAHRDRGHNRELYDLAADPYQLDNLIASPGWQTEAAVLDTWLAALATCAAAECHGLEDGPPAAS